MEVDYLDIKITSFLITPPFCHNQKDMCEKHGEVKPQKVEQKL